MTDFLSLKDLRDELSGKGPASAGPFLASVLNDIQKLEQPLIDDYGQQLYDSNPLIAAYRQALNLCVYLRQEIARRRLPEPQPAPAAFPVGTKLRKPHLPRCSEFSKYKMRPCREPARLLGLCVGHYIPLFCHKYQPTDGNRYFISHPSWRDAKCQWCGCGRTDKPERCPSRPLSDRAREILKAMEGG